MRTWLKDIREEQHMSQQEISERAEIAQPSYSNIELGKRNPSVDAAKKIASILNFPWTRFYDEAEEGADHSA